MNKYETQDINLACYLELRGNKCAITKLRDGATFVFESISQDLIDNYYADDGQYLTYANKLRNMKSRIKNIISEGR